MEKGFNVDIATDGGRKNILRQVKEGDSIKVVLKVLTDVMIAYNVSVYDSKNNVSVFLPQTIEKEEVKNTLYEKAIQVLWEDYNADVITYGQKSKEVRMVLDKINSLKAQTACYFGMTDLETGEHMIISMNINFDPKGFDKAGNNLHNALKKIEKHITKFPIEITKGSMGAWSAIPYMDDLTDNEQAVFNAYQEVPKEEYTKCMYMYSEETAKANLVKFSQQFGLDLAKLGINADEVQVTPNEASPFI